MSTPPRGNRDLIRAINRSAVLNTIKNQGPLSRTAIARYTRLSAATITAISAELIQDGLVFEKEAGDSSGGRRPILLALNPRAGYVVGLKLADDHVTGALTDLEATVLAKRTISLHDHTLENAVEVMVFLVDDLLAGRALDHKQLLGMGVGLAGIIDHRKGILRHSPIFGWRDVRLAARLAERLHVQVYLDNDVNTLTFTELWFGRGKGIENFLTVTVGRGVGLGIVVNGQVYQGLVGGAGEFGHVLVDPEGPPCACGKRGCLETFVSDPALMRMAAEAHARGDLSEQVTNIEQLYELARQDNQAAKAIYARAGVALGRGIANLVNLLNPQLIIISGEGVRAGDLLFEPMHAAIAAHVMPGLSGDTRIQIDVWDDDAWARGAAGLVLRELFESPIYHHMPQPA